jgi:hypothetical protein
MLPVRESQFLAHIFTVVQRHQPEQRSDILRLTRAHILHPYLAYLHQAWLERPRAEQTVWNTRDCV